MVEVEQHIENKMEIMLVEEVVDSAVTVVLLNLKLVDLEEDMEGMLVPVVIKILEVVVDMVEMEAMLVKVEAEVVEVMEEEQMVEKEVVYHHGLVEEEAVDILLKEEISEVAHHMDKAVVEIFYLDMAEEDIVDKMVEMVFV